MALDFEVVDLGPPDAHDEGERAPEFTRPLVTDEYWTDRALSELTDEGPVMLVFYPMDSAFPSTYLWQELTERAWDRDYDLRIVGLSVSDPYAHKQLIDERGMDYPLFSDPRNDVAREYGVAHDLDGMTGVEEPRLATFLLERDRRIAHRWVAREWPEFPDYDALEAAIADHCEAR